MTLAAIAKRTERFARDNSPTILTAVAVAGTISTAVLASRASIKAVEIIRADDVERALEGQELQTPRDKVRLVWTLYIPPVSIAAVTIASIIMVNRIGDRRTAAMAAAYGLAERGFEEYREKIVQKLGVQKEQSFRDEIAQEQVARTTEGLREVIVSSGEVLCYDAFTGRYFTSSVEQIKKAQNDINYEILHHNYASLSDFYDKIGLPSTAFSDDVGWNLSKRMEVNFSTVLSEDGRPCISISFITDPIRGFSKWSLGGH